MKHPVSTICSLMMTVALGVLIAFGIMLWKIDMLPDWAWIEHVASAACVLSFAAVGVAAVASGVCAAAFAERAMSAGPKYDRTKHLAFAYAGGCLLVDVLAAHVGFQILSGEPIVIAPDYRWLLLVAAIFVALARPLQSMVLQGVAQIDADQAEAKDAAERAAVLAEVNARAAETKARMSAAEPVGDNVEAFPREKRGAGLRTAAALGGAAIVALAGASAGQADVFATPAPIEGQAHAGQSEAVARLRAIGSRTMGQADLVTLARETSDLGLPKEDLIPLACALRDTGMTRAEVAEAMDRGVRTITRYWSEAETLMAGDVEVFA